ncbi:2S albumin precursor [Dorcoceras hygrometricum]|uniref:2S albumin n=1 Tax=Dorcoceras hygrometricum TaxID=472368 RepID=A0A2Z7BK29_9LAMI|nr:2S albumin precursor [Dorcoceras hygrometricum]
MAKNLALTAALVVAMLSLAAANTYTTTITTTIDDIDNPGQQQQCQRQLQGRRFQSCQRYLQQGRQGGRDDSEDGELVLPAESRGEQSESLRQCCDELRQVNERCRCEAIKQAVREQQQEGGGYRGQEFEEVYDRARNLPQRCQMRHPRQCQLSGVFL